MLKYDKRYDNNVLYLLVIHWNAILLVEVALPLGLRVE